MVAALVKLVNGRHTILMVWAADHVSVRVPLVVVARQTASLTSFWTFVTASVPLVVLAVSVAAVSVTFEVTNLIFVVVMSIDKMEVICQECRPRCLNNGSQ